MAHVQIMPHSSSGVDKRYFDLDETKYLLSIVPSKRGHGVIEAFVAWDYAIRLRSPVIPLSISSRRQDRSLLNFRPGCDPQYARGQLA